MAKSPEEMAQAMVNNLQAKTGKTLAQWLPIAKKSKLVKHGEIVSHLKKDHGMTHGFANLVAHYYLDSNSSTSAQTPEQLVDKQYAGDKSDLRPIYDAVLSLVSKFGNDVEVSPKKSYVSLRRGKQFAIVQPSTKDRVDIGINLKGTPPTQRLENSGSFNSMVSHRVRVDSKKDVNAELKKWLKAAYDVA